MFILIITLIAIVILIVFIMRDRYKNYWYSKMSEKLSSVWTLERNFLDLVSSDFSTSCIEIEKAIKKIKNERKKADELLLDANEMSLEVYDRLGYDEILAPFGEKVGDEYLEIFSIAWNIVAMEEEREEIEEIERDLM